MFEHDLQLRHYRRSMTSEYGKAPADSTTEVDARSSDLTAAWAELLSRLSPDVYAALKEAMGVQ